MTSACIWIVHSRLVSGHMLWGIAFVMWNPVVQPHCWAWHFADRCMIHRWGLPFWSPNCDFYILAGWILPCCHFSWNVLRDRDSCRSAGKVAFCQKQKEVCWGQNLFLYRNHFRHKGSSHMELTGAMADSEGRIPVMELPWRPWRVKISMIWQVHEREGRWKKPAVLPRGYAIDGASGSGTRATFIWEWWECNQKLWRILTMSIY